MHQYTVLTITSKVHQTYPRSIFLSEVYLSVLLMISYLMILPRQLLQPLSISNLFNSILDDKPFNRIICLSITMAIMCLAHLSQPDVL